MNRMSAPNSKKRPASSQDGPVAKKASIQRSNVDWRHKSKTQGRVVTGKDSQSSRQGKDQRKSRVQGDPKGKKRVLPVTKAPDEQESDSEGGSASELDEDVIGELGVDGMAVDEEGGAERMKDPNGNFFLHPSSQYSP